MIEWIDATETYENYFFQNAKYFVSRKISHLKRTWPVWDDGKKGRVVVFQKAEWLRRLEN